MLETTHRQGHGRIAKWQPTEGQSATTPTLVWPDIPMATKPDWIPITVTQNPDGKDGIVLTSTGTWFHPTEASGELVVASPRPDQTSVAQVLSVGKELAVFHDAAGWANNPGRVIEAWITAKNEATSGRLFWAPGMGTPADYALWVYLGVDVFDASPLLLAAVRGEALTLDGVRTAEEMEAIHGGEWDHDRLVAWNLEAARQELATVRLAIEKGNLRSLVERRVYTTARTVELLRRFDNQHTFLERQTPHSQPGLVPCMTQESLSMPEVRHFREKMREQYVRPEGADTLVLMPCSARKPYRLSPSHRRFARALDDSGVRHRVHEVMLTSPLGLVPRELENVYPAQNYDVPVTGSWTHDEVAMMRRQLKSLLERGNYSHVIAHVSGETWEVLRDLAPDAKHTVVGHATQDASLESLKTALKATGAGGDPRVGGKTRKVADMQALLSYQFGAAAAESLCKDARAMGKAPYIKLLGPEGQRGQTTPERGFASLTEIGAKLVAPHGVGRVHIGDFKPRGTSSLFAIGVERVDPEVRVGDEVIVVRGDDVRGGGVARMSGEEMTHANRGIAVGLRWTGGA